MVSNSVGHKQFVVQGASSDMLIVVARTAGSAGEQDGLTVFAVETDADGLSTEAARLGRFEHGRAYQIRWR